MALPSSGTISLNNLQGEFGGSNPIQISEYYRGDGLVPNITANNDIPLSGLIKLSDFYNSTAVSGNLLEVISSGTLGTPPVKFAEVTNSSSSAQTFTYTWEYVGQSGDIDTTVTYDLTTRSPGYTTPTLSETFSSGDDLVFYVPFFFSGGNATTVECEFTLISASIDTVPSSPDNKATVYIDVNF